MPITAKLALLGPHEHELVEAVLESGDLSGNARAVDEYQQELATFFACAHALACSSGSAALQLALAGVGVGPGDEVLVPATGAVMSALPILALGARPKFIDVSRDSFAPPVSQVAPALNAHTRAVVVVAMWGYDDGAAALHAYCQERALPLIEDAAQAHGSVVHGRLIGTCGDVGAFSTHARKLVATGEGGFCLTDDAELAVRLFELRTLGQDASGDPASFGTRFGFNFKLPAVAAALGRAQLNRLPERVSARNVVADRWLEELSRCDVKVIDRPEIHNCYGLAVLAAPDAHAAVEEALYECGFVTDTRSYGYRVLPRYPVFRDCEEAALPNAEALAGQLVVLPCHEAVTTADIRRGANAIKRAGGGR